MNHKNRDPVLILEQLLWKLIPGNYTPFGEICEWKVSRNFFDHDFSDLESIETSFLSEYESVISKVQATWGTPDFQGNGYSPHYPNWYWSGIIQMSYWIKEEGIAYVSYRRDDKELPYEITLGAITEEAVEDVF